MRLYIVPSSCEAKRLTDEVVARKRTDQSGSALSVSNSNDHFTSHVHSLSRELITLSQNVAAIVYSRKPHAQCISRLLLTPASSQTQLLVDRYKCGESRHPRDL